MSPHKSAARKTAIVVLAAGMGTRMKSDLPKVMHPLAGRPMIRHLLDTVSGLNPERVVVVIGPEMESVAVAVAPARIVVQQERLGTGHAVKAAAGALKDFEGDVLVVYGDTPLITRETLGRMLEVRRGPGDPAVVVLGFRPLDDNQYGRLILNAEGGLERIVEWRDASPEERKGTLCNSGVMAVDGARLEALLARIGRENAKGEYYLTDIVGLARDDGRACAVVEGRVEELLGINSRLELAEAEGIVQNALRRRAMENGATLTDPASVWFSFDTQLGHDVTIGPNVVFLPGVSVGNKVDIKGFCHFDHARIASGAQIGPFARLRPGADIADDAHIGNFVEIKGSTIERGAKVNHLTYIGDARVGAGTNVGAGTITCNYDGYTKARTEIGTNAFIGSNTSLVAPVTIGDGAIIGAGSVIAKDVPADALSLTRAPQQDLVGWARGFRERKTAEKSGKNK